MDMEGDEYLSHLHYTYCTMNYILKFKVTETLFTVSFYVINVKLYWVLVSYILRWTPPPPPLPHSTARSGDWKLVPPLGNKKHFVGPCWCCVFYPSGMLKSSSKLVPTPQFWILIRRTVLKGQCHEICCFWFFFMNQFPPSPRVFH